MENNLKNRLFSTGIRIIAFALFPLIWFLTQAILFRELSKTADRWLLITLAILVGSSFIFILYLGMNKLISYAPKQYQEALFGAMFVGPAIFLLSLFLLYPAIRTIYLSFFDNRGENFIGLENYRWSVTDPAMLITIRNQIFWLIGVVFLVILFGLVVAYLSDRLRRGESFFKSIIFMPMAISFVGAGVIWKFIYEYRGPENTQIGLLNAIIVSLGYEPQAWLTIPMWNNFFLMAIMIWIQTGLALVIFSAALRSIPKEMLEAARIDGASELKIFFSIIIPYLEQTILVIWTLITIIVLRIFDIIFAMTNGEWQTGVLANLMYDWMFRGGGDSGRGSVLAIVIMIGVIPILAWNLYKHRQEQKI